MDQPARKRRKTASPGQSERESSPLKKPPRRPSFASPTKASISRFNPSLLPARATSPGKAASRPSSRGEILNRGKRARDFILGGNESQEESAQGIRQSIAGANERANAPGDLTPRAHRITRTGDTTKGRDRALINEDEDLPSSPARQVESEDRPRRGVLFSSPSKRPTRKRQFGKAVPQGIDSQAATPLPRSSPVVEGSNDASVEMEDTRQDDTAKERTTPDPEEESRKHERETLLRELKGLQDDIGWCRNKIERYQESIPEVMDQAERDALISFINKLDEARDEDETSKPPLVSDLLSSFLPFTAQPVLAPPPDPDSEQPIPSHQPVDLDNPLPYLQMFTPMTITHRTKLAATYKPGSGSQTVYQKHEINLVGPLKLLNASIEATVDTATHTVAKLQVTGLSQWADHELGTFIREKAQSKDISTACWAIGSYWEIAKKRAEYRYKCATAFKHLTPGNAGEDTENMILSSAKPTSSNMSRRDLNKHLGRDVVVLEDRHILLKITWRIVFDCTGEAESEINIEPAFPRVWTETDEGQNLKMVPKTFNALVQRSGVFEATKTIAALLFSE
ncbi:hypothetical protein BU24DRAFT_450763 [Aaosphaeria arxii CBS 175.79]|uniref:Uncharacterized protein n=1 Tax=Aaosphaeria arxii CBS 175.79 TaxID=1450172 RepID=A0A6A5XVA1_9PLEO|nr:uncharacterized protein BU24DRAFT_450763 [Aaosphaeria arxii CBS 175.79]KAF2016184.1 hypothetical protein BU24DRAFT_450763 [Aaosphaeria arxii CBS 175.79]